MKIGNLRHRIKIMKFSVYEDEWYNQIEEWLEIATLWAKVSNLHGKEYLAAAALQLERTLLFTTRFFPGLDESMLIQFQGKDYDIKFVDNIKYLNRYLEIRAELKIR